ncbi:MAG: hypothetical protein NTV09_07435, partial [Bacteroidetes bacterium]|nr:hypothetical protein [Bacteroidota bacterium]
TKTSDGFILCGDSAQSAYIIKVDLCGQLQWSRTYSDTLTLHAHCIVESRNGYTLIGAKNGGGGQTGTGAQAWMLRMDENGDSLWSKFYDVGYWASWGTWITKRPIGYAICIFSDGQQQYNSNTLFLTDTSGNMLDTVVVNTSASGGFHNSDIIPTSDGGFISASSNALTSVDQIQVVKVDSNFDMEFEKWYQDIVFFLAYSANAVCEAPGGYMVVGSTDITGSIQKYMMMLDLNGDSLWTKILDSGVFICVKTLPDGFIMASESTLVRTDFNADTLWTKPVNGTIHYLDVTDDGYVLIGDTSITWQQNSDVWLMLTDTYGNEISCTTLGLSHPTEKTIDIFPNPSSGPVTINYPGDIFIYDTQGSLIEKSFDSVTLSLPTGMYFVRTGLECRKLLVIK